MTSTFGETRLTQRKTKVFPSPISGAVSQSRCQYSLRKTSVRCRPCKEQRQSCEKPCVSHKEAVSSSL